MQQSLLFVPTRCALTDNSMSLFLLISSVETWWMHSLKEVQTIAVLNCHHRPMAMYLSVVPLIPTKPIGLLCLVVMFLYFVGSVLLITDRGCRFSTFKLLECHSVQCYSFCCITPSMPLFLFPHFFLSCLLLIALVVETVDPPWTLCFNLLVNFFMPLTCTHPSHSSLFHFCFLTITIT